MDNPMQEWRGGPADLEEVFDEEVAESRSGLGVLIPHRNPAALAGYYVGILALFPVLGFLLAPIALILGIRGLSTARRNRLAHGRVHAWIGVLLGFIALIGQPFLSYVLWMIYRDVIMAFMRL